MKIKYKNVNLGSFLVGWWSCLSGSNLSSTEFLGRKSPPALLGRAATSSALPGCQTHALVRPRLWRQSRQIKHSSQTPNKSRSLCSPSDRGQFLVLTIIQLSHKLPTYLQMHNDIINILNKESTLMSWTGALISLCKMIHHTI